MGSREASAIANLPPSLPEREGVDPEFKKVIEETFSELYRSNASLATNAVLFDEVTTNITTVTGNLTLGEHTTIVVDASSPGIVITLPSAANQKGREYVVKHNGGVNSVDIYVQTGDSLDTVSTNPAFTLPASSRDSITMKSDGVTSWWIV